MPDRTVSVVDSSRWVEKLLPQGVKCIQLRIKDTPKTLLEEEVKRSVCLAKKYGATLFINDYWSLLSALLQKVFILVKRICTQQILIPFISQGCIWV